MGEKGDTRGGRIRPAFLAPLALTIAFFGAAWLFYEKTAADRDAMITAAHRLERYAREEAEDILRASVDAAGEFVAARKKARRGQEDAMNLEVRGIMDSVCGLISLSLERNRRQATERREVGAFPSGFDGVRRFLEIRPDRTDDGDRALSALQADTPEISALLPPSYALTIVEDHSREMLRLGAVQTGEGFVGSSTVRDLMFADSGRDRRWTVKLELTARDQYPPVTPRELAELLDRRLGNVRPDNVLWRGWIIAGVDEVAAAYPEPANPDRADVSFIAGAGEWKELDGRQLLRLERVSRPAGMDWDLGVSVAIAVPDDPPVFPDAVFANDGWALSLGGLAFFAAAGWIWAGMRAAASKRRPAERGAPLQAPRQIRRRVVRDDEAERAVPEVQGVIVADLPGDGRVHIERESVVRPGREEMPSGSLKRLQAIHRGKKNGNGSRILDQAKSPLLRGLAERVRPPETGQERPQRATPAGGLPDAPAGTGSQPGWRKAW